jgi:hypothetical protein
VNVEGQIAPVEPEGGDPGIMHGGGSRVSDRMAQHGA